VSLIDRILSIIAPHDCLGCGKEGKLLCFSCLASLPEVSPKRLQSPYLTEVRSASHYKGVAKELVWKLKSSGAQEAARIMATCMLKHFTKSKNSLIVHVPTATSRVRQRGYDQASLLARELAKQSKLPCLSCLIRTGQAHQVGAGREQRLSQLNNAFRLKSSLLIKNAHIILVDDVVTTGATLEIVASLLKQAGASKIEAITFAQPQMRNIAH
jgi:ComF family protein